MSTTNTLQHPVLTHAELVNYLRRERPTRSARTIESILAYKVETGRLLRIRRGLFASVPPGHNVATYVVDPFLVASKATDDAVIAYHAALEFFGRAYSTFDRFDFVTTKRMRPFQFRSCEFRAIPVPKAIVGRSSALFGVREVPRDGLVVRVTSLERTMVDVFNRLDLAGGCEEVWRSLEMVEYFDLDAVVRYAALLDSATTAAKVGFFLEQHAESLMVTEQYLQQLEEQRPKRPHYMQPSSRGGKLFSRWNLIVPDTVVSRAWEES